MISIPLKNGGVALIDDEDQGLIVGRSWWQNDKGYAYTSNPVNSRNKTTLMHRVILIPPKGLVIDHINGNKLDNRRANLRIVTHGQNMQNLHKVRSDSVSGARNVLYTPINSRGNPRKRPYAVRLVIQGRSMSFGYYETIEEAAIVAAEARRKHMSHAPECLEMSKEEFWGMSLDDCAEAIYQIPNDAVGAHYIAFEGNQETARQKMIDAFTAFIDKHLYRANSYGSPSREGNED